MTVFLGQTAVFVFVTALSLLIVYLDSNLPDLKNSSSNQCNIEIHLDGLIEAISSNCCLRGAETSLTRDLRKTLSLKWLVYMGVTSHTYSIHCLSLARVPLSQLSSEKEAESAEGWICGSVVEWVGRWRLHRVRNEGCILLLHPQTSSLDL